MKRLGIINISGHWLEDFAPIIARDKRNATLQDVIQAIKLPHVFRATELIYEFDTDGLRLKVESDILPIHLDGELICNVDLIYENGIPIRCLIYNRTIIKEQAYEKTFNR